MTKISQTFENFICGSTNGFKRSRQVIKVHYKPFTDQTEAFRLFYTKKWISENLVNKIIRSVKGTYPSDIYFQPTNEIKNNKNSLDITPFDTSFTYVVHCDVYFKFSHSAHQCPPHT